MKTRVKAKDLTKAITTVLAVHAFGDSNDDRQPCCLTATEDSLVVESAKMGAYVVKRIPGKLLRAGSCGVNAKDLAGMKLQGDVTIDAGSAEIKIQDKRTKYVWAQDNNAASDVKEQQNTTTTVKPTAKLPTLVMKAGAKFATYKSEIKGDYDVQLTFDNQYFEYCGLDHLSYGRYEIKSTAIKAKKASHFILGQSLLAKVIKEVDGDAIMIGGSEDGSLVRLSSGDLDLFHPTVDKQYMSTQDAITQATSGELACRFTIEGRELKDALDRVAPVGKKAAEAEMEFSISSKGQIKLRQLAVANAAESLIKTKDVTTEGALSIPIRAQYLKEFVKVAPTSMPLTVESWDQKFLRITVKEDPAIIDYLAMMLAE